MTTPLRTGRVWDLWLKGSWTSVPTLTTTSPDVCGVMTAGALKSEARTAKFITSSDIVISDMRHTR